MPESAEQLQNTRRNQILLQINTSLQEIKVQLMRIAEQLQRDRSNETK